MREKKKLMGVEKIDLLENIKVIKILPCDIIN